MNSTGIVMQTEKRYAFIMTNNGEFLKVKVTNPMPNLGEIYSGEVAKETPFYKYTAAAASLLFVLLSGTASYAYYTPTASVVVDINPSIEIQVNRWDRILTTTALNKDGEKVLASLNIKNKVLSDGLDLIVEEAKRDNFINDSYIQSGKAITVSFENTKSDRKPDISKFEENAKKNSLKVNLIKDNEDKKEIEKVNPSNPSDNSNKQQNGTEEKSNNGNKNDQKINVPNTNGSSSNGSTNNKQEENNGNKNRIRSIKDSILSRFQVHKVQPNSNNDNNKKSEDKSKNKYSESDNKDKK
ncbi:MAG: hypothetical protein K0R09_2856 [Clostridiales bacterium]|nr:hypothetical protein [Clostridiales bacterium]